MHYRHVFFTWIVCLLVSSCASTIKVDTDYDPENDFSGYQSYDWHDEVSAPNQIVEDRMRNAIELALKANAYVRVESGAAPDFLVSFSAVSVGLSGLTRFPPAWAIVAEGGASAYRPQIASGNIPRGH
jgi:hypothetical protein